MTQYLLPLASQPSSCPVLLVGLAEYQATAHLDDRLMTSIIKRNTPRHHMGKRGVILHASVTWFLVRGGQILLGTPVGR